MGRCLNCIHFDVCDTDRCEKERLYGDCSDFLNDADVVPKSELELYMQLYHEVEEELASTYDKLENAKSEVAKIFEEIEKQIDLTVSVIQKILNARGGRSNGNTVLLSKYDMIMESKKFIAELKKKYTED